MPKFNDGSTGHAGKLVPRNVKTSRWWWLPPSATPAAETASPPGIGTWIWAWDWRVIALKPARSLV